MINLSLRQRWHNKTVNKSKSQLFLKKNIDLQKLFFFINILLFQKQRFVPKK